MYDMNKTLSKPMCQPINNNKYYLCLNTKRSNIVYQYVFIKMKYVNDNTRNGNLLLYSYMKREWIN